MISLRTLRHSILRAALIATVLLAGLAFTAPLAKPSYIIPKTVPLPGGLSTYYWRVRDSVTGQWTLPWSFALQ